MITLRQMRNIIPDAPDDFLEKLNDAMERYQIVTPYQEAAFLAHVAHDGFYGSAVARAEAWDSLKLNNLADQDDFRGITRALCGGYSTYNERRKIYKKARTALGI